MVRSQHDLWSVWGESGMAIVDEPNDPILWASRDVEDELHAATFDLLHGFYRQAVASLRSCLELMLVGCYRTVADAPDGFSFKRIAEKIRAISHVQALDQRLDVSCGRTLFGRENYWRPLVNGWTLERRARQQRPSGDGDPGNTQPARERLMARPDQAGMPTAAASGPGGAS